MFRIDDHVQQHVNLTLQQFDKIKNMSIMVKLAPTHANKLVELTPIN